MASSKTSRTARASAPTLPAMPAVKPADTVDERVRRYRNDAIAALVGLEAALVERGDNDAMWVEDMREEIDDHVGED